MLNRVLTVACGFSFSVAVAGCANLAPQAIGDDGQFRISTAMANTEQGGEAIVVRPTTIKGDEHIETQPNSDLIFDAISIPSEIQQDTAKKSRQGVNILFDTQADRAAHELPESPETTVHDAALVPLKTAVDDNPERLMGLGVEELITMLGSPRFVRRDSLAQLWRYRIKSCILDLFLYRNIGRSKFLVNYTEARRPKGGRAVKRKCFGALLLKKLVGEVG